MIFGSKPVILYFTLWQLLAKLSDMAMTMRVVVPPHPLIAHWLTVLRSSSTPPALYGTALEELGRWLTYEAIREWLPNRKEHVLTSNGQVEGTVIETNVPLISIPFDHGGLALWQGARKVLPTTELCIGGIPIQIEKNAGVIVFIDQIDNAEETLKLLLRLQEKHLTGQRLRLICALASSPGLKLLGSDLPDLTVYTGCIDPEVNKNNEIIPGIGNPTLRLNSRNSEPI